MVSYIVGAEFTGHEAFSGSLPSVFDVQNLIENAWDMGINPRGRIETGGIRLTRKYIGTPEAIALLQSLNIPCSISAFKHKTPGKSGDLLFRDVEQYFSRGKYEAGQKVRTTTLPPIYWQHPGHSLTIVGIEKTTEGETNLLVFDPVFRDTSMMARLVGHKHTHPAHLLRPYRRGPRYLSRFRAFEILKYGCPVSHPLPLPPHFFFFLFLSYDFPALTPITDCNLWPRILITALKQRDALNHRDGIDFTPGLRGYDTHSYLFTISVTYGWLCNPAQRCIAFFN